MKSNFNDATDIISFCHKDALGKNKKHENTEVYTIVKSDIINQIWIENNETYTKKDIEFIVNSFIKIVGQGIKNDLKIKIEGLGTFSSYVRKTKSGKNVNENFDDIQTQKYISFKPSNKIKPNK